MFDVLDGHPQSLDLAHPFPTGLGAGQPRPELGKPLVAVLHPGPLPLAGRPLVLLPLHGILKPFNPSLGLSPTRPPGVISLYEDLPVLAGLLLERVILAITVESAGGLTGGEPDLLRLRPC